MSAVIAEVSVENTTGGRVDVIFTFPGRQETVRLPLPDRHLLAAFRRKAEVYLERLVGLAGRLRVEPGRARDAFALLHNAGWELTYLLVQDDLARFEHLQSAFRRAWPWWNADAWDDPTRPIPVVEMRCRDEALPIELLPVFDYGPMRDIVTVDDLTRAASCFLGFTTVVQRTTSAPIPANRTLANEPTLPVQFIRHSRLRSAGEEARSLAAMNAHVSVEGPWPTTQDPARVLDALTASLLHRTPLDGEAAADAASVQIQHFSCHCDTTTELEDDYTLTMSTGSGRSRVVSFGQLREAYRKQFAVDHGQSRERAVIILNACGSTRANPLSGSSFPRWFLQFGHRAFLGVEAVVPDGVAGGFTAAFYGRLLQRRRPLGEAVVWARRDLLRDYRNPLGLLYVLYGDASLTVRHERPGVYRASA